MGTQRTRGGCCYQKWEFQERSIVVYENAPW